MVLCGVQGVRHDAAHLSSDPVFGYCVSTTLVSMLTSGLVAAHIMRNIEPNYAVLSEFLREVRTWLVQLVSIAWGNGRGKHVAAVGAQVLHLDRVWFNDYLYLRSLCAPSGWCVCRGLCCVLNASYCMWVIV